MRSSLRKQLILRPRRGSTCSALFGRVRNAKKGHFSQTYVSWIDKEDWEERQREDDNEEVTKVVEEDRQPVRKIVESWNTHFLQKEER